MRRSASRADTAGSRGSAGGERPTGSPERRAEGVEVAVEELVFAPEEDQSIIEIEDEASDIHEQRTRTGCDDAEDRAALDRLALDQVDDFAIIDRSAQRFAGDGLVAGDKRIPAYTRR